MIILTKSEQVDLRRLFDHDKNDVFLAFMKKLEEQILKKPSVGESEYQTLLMTITRQAQYDCINLILEQLNEEISNMEAEENV